MSKHRAIFSANVSLARAGVSTDTTISFASLDNLKGLNIPESVNLKDNRDLICVGFNGFVANQCNGNDDMIDVKTSLMVKDMFLHKPLDVEHDTSYVVGHVVATGWSDIETSSLISDEDVSAMVEPVNFSLAAVVYAANNKRIKEAIIESTDPTKEFYEGISASWEIRFEHYHIVLGSRNLKDATIISDAEGIAKYSKYLRCYGGSGRTEEGVFVGRKLVGDKTNLTPAGFALTTNPAAKVKGLTLIGEEEYNEEEEEEEDNDAKGYASANIPNESKASAKKEEINLQTKEFSVIKKDMKIEKINDVYNAFKEAELATAAQSVVECHIKESLMAASEAWDKEKADKAEAIAKAEKEKNEISAKLSGAEAEIAKLKEQILAIASEAAKKAADDAFSCRLEYISKEFKLSNEQREIAIAELRGLTSDEEYTSWLSRFEIMNCEKRVSVASKNETLEGVLETSKASLNTAMPNVGAEECGSIEALAKKIKITSVYSK